MALLGSISPHDHFKLEAWESSASWIAAVPRNLTELEKIVPNSIPCNVVTQDKAGKVNI